MAFGAVRDRLLLVVAMCVFALDAGAFMPLANTALGTDLIAQGDKALAMDSSPYGAVIFYEEARSYAQTSDDWRALFTISLRYAAMSNGGVAMHTYEEGMQVALRLAMSPERKVRCIEGLSALEAGVQSWNGVGWQLPLAKDEQIVLGTIAKQASRTWQHLSAECTK